MSVVIPLLFAVVVGGIVLALALRADRRREEREARWRKDGTPLESTCPRCGRFNHAGSRRCVYCGRPFRRLPSAS